MLTVASEPHAPPDDVAVIRNGLVAFNDRATGNNAAREPSVHLARDQTGAVVGGCLGYRRWGVLHVDFLWVADEHRGHNVGTRLLSAAEAEAIRAGCTVAMLDTFDFQAKPFYEALGYKVWGVLDDLPHGRVEYYLRKELA